MTREEAKEICRKRMLSGEPFGLSKIVQLLMQENGGKPVTEDRADCDRIADAMIQQFRKKGLISFVRHGRGAIWTVTEAGRKYAKAQTEGGG